MTGTTPPGLSPLLQNHRTLCPSRGGGSRAVPFPTPASPASCPLPPAPCPLPSAPAPLSRTPCPLPLPPLLTGSFTNSWSPSPCRRPCRYAVASRCCRQLFSRPCAGRGHQVGRAGSGVRKLAGIHSRGNSAGEDSSPGLHSEPLQSPFEPPVLGPGSGPRHYLGAGGNSLGLGEEEGEGTASCWLLGTGEVRSWGEGVCGPHPASCLPSTLTPTIRIPCGPTLSPSSESPPVSTQPSWVLVTATFIPAWPWVVAL